MGMRFKSSLFCKYSTWDTLSRQQMINIDPCFIFSYILISFEIRLFIIIVWVQLELILHKKCSFLETADLVTLTEEILKENFIFCALWDKILTIPLSIVLVESWWRINLLQRSVSFHIKTSYLICTASQMADFYMKCNTGLKWVNQTFWFGVTWKKMSIWLLRNYFLFELVFFIL